MKEVIKRRLVYLREKINNSKSRTEYNSYLKEYNELYLDWNELEEGGKNASKSL